VRECPFCGSGDITTMTVVIDGENNLRAMMCLNCRARGPLAINKKLAIQQWNTRPSYDLNVEARFQILEGQVLAIDKRCKGEL
jgi:Lar family restriction alleviation protein